MITATAVQTRVCSNHGSNPEKQTLRQRLAARRLIRRAWSDLYADLDAQTTSRVDSWDRRVSA